MIGKVIALSISTEKGVPKTNVEKVRIIESWGIAGDAHAGDWHRQISLLSLESINQMRIKGADVHPGNFAENITTSGIDLLQIPIGGRIWVSDVELEITQIGKVCHSHCAIFYSVGDCIMPREGVFVKVLHGGEVKVGDMITTIAVEKDS
ncbi:MAG: MOSC domain-containing protein [bacterium]|nr:MOSC domain-containing protein [bacterium]